MSRPSPARYSKPRHGAQALARLGFLFVTATLLGAGLVTLLPSPPSAHAATPRPLTAAARFASTTSPTPAVRAAASARHAVSLIHRDFPRAQWTSAVAVARCESTLRSWAVHFDSNGTVDRGLFQFNSGGTEQELLSLTHHSPSDLNLAYSPSWNVAAAAVLWRRDGWSHWSCAP